ncbi:CaiB/BaiF CoA transferase family protein [Roseitranquillus sediminis]|uniref:CaiB/BaiF CoA transferase family protein n=1 Tax=Roseitranquillus sediminis TaxID=2809051 RepID=UPI001D0CA69F|nr:CoA transferase [Roseitranquillus sediminis]MBM9594708.1 CoA transferase [Roseitranquillus sediminis]
MTGPLAGLKVVEFGNAMAGPYCGMTLADYGAEVVKIERLEVGDDSRMWTPHFHGAVAAYFASANRNKKSFAADLKSPKGVEVVRKLILGSDVVIDNYRLGALARAGLDYETLSRENPRLIYASISGFGASGPLKDVPCNDLRMQAYSGGMSITGYPDGDPVKMGISVCDVGAGMLATIGILIALQVRQQTGRGQRVDTSLLEGQVSMLSYHITRFFASGVVPKGGGSGGLANPTYRAFRATDGWFVISCFNDRMWRDLCAALGKEEWIADPRFLTSTLRSENRYVLMEMLEEIIAREPKAHWINALEARNVPCSPIHTIAEMVEQEQVEARDMMVDIELEGLGPMRMGGLPLKFSETPGAVRMHPPRLGQHTREVLESLEIAQSEIVALAEAGAVGLDQGWAIKGTPAGNKS